MSDTIQERSAELTDEYARRLDEFVNEIVPPVLGNAEYAARCSALLIALGRQLARCAASFGEVHRIDQAQMIDVVTAQFRRNYAISIAALEGQGAGQMVS